MRCENFAAQPSHIFKPRAEVFRQLLVDLAAQLLRDGGTLAGCGDGNLQRSTADHGTEVEIAVRRIIDAVCQDATRNSVLVNGCIDLDRIGGGDDQEVVIEVGEFERSLNPFETCLLYTSRCV